MATSRFIRFFSRRQLKSEHSTDEKSHSIIKQGFVCTVVFLDGEHVNFEVDVSDEYRRCVSCLVDHFSSSAKLLANIYMIKLLHIPN